MGSFRHSNSHMGLSSLSTCSLILKATPNSQSCRELDNLNKATPLLVVVAVVVAVSASSAAGKTKTHVVGDIFGWTNLGNDTDFYNLWASIYEFHVNDTLLFKFKTGEHTVAEVSKEAYEKCDTSNAMTLHKEGPALNIRLSSQGPKFFICTIPGHCQEDERFSINVSSASPIS